MVQTGRETAVSGFNFHIYAIAAAISLVLSFWGAWAQFIPNTDAALYLRSAELLANGRWAAADVTSSPYTALLSQP